MDHREAGKYWEGNAEAWTRLARAGFDVYRDHLNTPAFFAMLPDITGMRGIDIGCGEGHNTRLLAERCTSLVAIDISPTFLRHASHWPDLSPNISYVEASAIGLPFADHRFDFATAFMSLMDVPETSQAIQEAFRILRPGGFLQFSITHPCFTTPHRRNLRDLSHRTYAIEVGGYFKQLDGDIDEWSFRSAPTEIAAGLPKFKTPRFTRTVSQWLNLLVETGFAIERVEEPQPSDGVVLDHPKLQDAQVVAYFLHVRARRPGPGRKIE